MSLRVLVAVLLTAGAFLGVRAWNAHLIAQGYEQGSKAVRTEWATAEAKRRGDEMEAAALASQKQADAERQAREAEQAKQIQAERTAREQAQREGALRTALDRAAASNRSLLDRIAALDARAAAAAADVPTTAPDARAAALAHEAATARQLLGSCSQRYAELGADADGLRIQVMGLQDYVKGVVAPAAMGGSNGL
jgi:hypothetical protein